MAITLEQMGEAYIGQVRQEIERIKVVLQDNKTMLERTTAHLEDCQKALAGSRSRAETEVISFPNPFQNLTKDN